MDMIVRRAAPLIAAALIIFLITPLLAAAATDDDRIYDEVRRKLANDVDVGAAGIEVQVKDGKVTLTGRVRTEKAKTKATQIAKKVKGVVSVDNELKLLASD
jgi:osmotically-inducible protein OsmY